MNEIPKTMWDFKIQTEHLIPKIKPEDKAKFLSTPCHLMDYAFPVEHKLKIKERENIKFSNIVR